MKQVAGGEWLIGGAVEERLQQFGDAGGMHALDDCKSVSHPRQLSLDSLLS
jgi:hypothetical protein